MPQYSTAVRNGLCASLAQSIGQAPRLGIFGGSPPVSWADPSSPELLAMFQLPNDWLVQLVDGEYGAAGLPLTTVASAKGKATHYRLFDGSGNACHEQGGVWMEGDDTPEDLRDMQIANTDIAKNQAVQVMEFTKVAPG